MAKRDVSFGWTILDGFIGLCQRLRLKRLTKVQPYLLVAPAFLMVGLLAIGIIYLSWFSIHAYDTFLLRQGDLSAEQYQRLFAPPSGSFYEQTLLRTVVMSVVVTAASVILGLPVAYVIVRSRSRMLRVIILVLLLVPFLMGEIVRTFAWYLILANRGALGWLASLFGIKDGGLLGTSLGVFIGMLQVSVPLVALLVLPAIRRIDPNLERAAATLGAPPARIWGHIIVPLAWPGLAAATVVVLLLNIAEYDMPAILGLGQLPFVANVIGDIYRLQQNLYLGSAFSLLLLAISTMIIVIAFALVQLYSGIRARQKAKLWAR